MVVFVHSDGKSFELVMLQTTLGLHRQHAICLLLSIQEHNWLQPSICIYRESRASDKAKCSLQGPTCNASQQWMRADRWNRISLWELSGVNYGKELPLIKEINYLTTDLITQHVSSDSSGDFENEDQTEENSKLQEKQQTHYLLLMRQYSQPNSWVQLHNITPA